MDSHTCISHAEKCYSKLYTVYKHENGTAQSSRDEHGCIDLVNVVSRGSASCDSNGDVVKQLKELEPLIMCCSDNMCNYRKSQDIQVDIIESTVVSQGGSCGVVVVLVRFLSINCFLSISCVEHRTSLIK